MPIDGPVGAAVGARLALAGSGGAVAARSLPDDRPKSHAPRKENRVSAARGSIGERGSRTKTDSRKKEQESLPFVVSR